MPFIVLAVSLCLIAADQLTKYWMDLHLKPVGSIEIIKDLFSFDYLENRGAALGILQNHRWVFIVLTVVICVAMVVFLFRYREHKAWSYVSICLIFAGGVGNLIDRIWRGYVIDFIFVHFFPYKFNLADCYVTVGAFLLLIAVLISERKKPAEERLQDEKHE